MTINPFFDSSALERQLLERLAGDRLVDPPRPRSSLEIQRDVAERERAERNHERWPLAG